jgi:alkanesulfonate monooxygenase SsuD/methylene tetrahydromethanopterin reductase-like flavin-dependent oxidoreductase (luciferase family)
VNGPLGLSIASHSGLPPAAVGAVAGAAEEAGFGAVFVAEGHGDALALCHPVAAAQAARAVVLRYVLHPAVPRLFGELDGGPSLGGVREVLLAGDRAGAVGRVPQQVADGFVAHGDAARCAGRVAQYQAAGVDLPVLFPVPIGSDWGYEKVITVLGDAATAP